MLSSYALQLGTLNCQSVRKKIPEVVQHLQANNVNICMLQETFLTNNDGALLKQINDLGMNISFFPHNDGRQHDGLAFLSNTSINLQQYRNGHTGKSNWKTVEHYVMVLKTRAIKFYYAIYIVHHTVITTLTLFISFLKNLRTFLKLVF